MVPDFDVSSVRDDSLVVIIGKRASGKTHLALDLVSRHGIPYGVASSAKEQRKEEYGLVMPSALVHVEECACEVVAKFLTRQRTASKAARIEGVDARGFIVLEDTFYDMSWTKDSGVRALFLNNRSWRSFVVMAMQYAVRMPPMFRANTDFVFLFRERNAQNRRRLWEQYGSFATFEEFEAAFEECTAGPWSCMVIDAMAREGPNVFKYTAPSERASGQLCSTSFSFPERSRL